MGCRNNDKIIMCPYSKVIERDFKVKNIHGATVKLRVVMDRGSGQRAGHSVSYLYHLFNEEITAYKRNSVSTK